MTKAEQETKAKIPEAECLRGTLNPDIWFIWIPDRRIVSGHRVIGHGWKPGWAWRQAAKKLARYPMLVSNASGPGAG